MALLSLFISISYFFLDCCVAIGQDLQNGTIDDNDPAIRYTGQWNTSTAVISLNTGGTHRYTQDQNAQASLGFTGVAVYFLSPLWPYDVTTQVQLDSRLPETLNLRDFSRPDAGGGWETVGSHVVWSADGLPNVRHVLTMSVGAGEQWAVVDAFIVTWVNGTTTTTHSATTTQNITTTQSQSLLRAIPTVPMTVIVSTTQIATFSSNPSGTLPSPSLPRDKNTIIIGLCSAIGIYVLFISVLICFYFYQKQFKRRHQPQVNLQEELAFIPTSLPAPPVPPWSPTLDVNSPTSPERNLVVQSPDQQHFTVVPLAPRQYRSSMNTSSATASRRNIPGKPPNYDESVTVHRRARRGVLRKSRTVPRNPD